MNNLSKPKLLEDTLVLEENNNFVFIVPSKPDWVSVNQNGASLLSLCDGTRTLDDIKKLVKENHPKPDEAMLFLEKLIEKNFFTKAEVKIESKKAIHSLHLNMTEKCNLSCVYCYAEEREKSSSSVLDIQIYYKIIDEAFDLNSAVTVTFTGGEPLLNPYTIELAQYCKSKNISTFLLTNGTLIKEGNAKTIANSFDTIRISIDGSTANIHDLYRGNGSFEKSLIGINLLEKYGAMPLIAMTVTSTNLNDISKAAERFGNRLTFQPLYKLGNAKGKGLEITGKEYFEALKKAKNVEVYGGIANTMETLRNNACGRCAVGEGEISISATGDVYPCHMLHEKEFLAGNIVYDSLTQIYENSSVLQSIRKLSVDTREDCKDCAVRFLCCGGCWARAYFEHGNLNKADTFCEYEQLAFKEALLQ